MNTFKKIVGYTVAFGLMGWGSFIAIGILATPKWLAVISTILVGIAVLLYTMDTHAKDY